MPANPYRAALALIGFGLTILGAAAWAIGSNAAVTTDTVNGPIAAAAGAAMFGFGVVALIGWLVVCAIQWTGKNPGAEKD